MLDTGLYPYWLSSWVENVNFMIFITNNKMAEEITSDPLSDLSLQNGKDVSVVIIDAVLIVIIVASVLGNLLVCAVIAKVKKLQKPGNIFIASLAVADLFVALVIMPFSLSTQLVDHAVFSPIFCDVWVSLDVMFCSTSLIHLCVISIDRYTKISKPMKYKGLMSNAIAFKILAVVWMVSGLKSFLPICVGWAKTDSSYAVSGDDQNTSLPLESNNLNILSEISVEPDWILAGFVYCDHAFNPTYAIITCFIDFFIPCAIMISVYALIFRRVRLRSKSLRLGRLSDMSNSSSTPGLRASCEDTSDRKAAIMLGIIIGFFVACWLPFFVDLFVCSVRNCQSYHSTTSQVITWLGYANSCHQSFRVCRLQPRIPKVSLLFEKSWQAC